jgi:hypothetical protein
VLVHGIDVEKVVLHLAHDAAPGREVGAQDIELVEAAELVNQAPRTLE